MITIMGATGHTGRVAAESLLKEGHKVRALGRSQERLAGLVSLGAEAVAGDPADAAYLARAFRGSDVVYTLIFSDPVNPDYPTYQNRIGEAVAGALEKSGVKHAVLLSSLGADQPSGTGPIAGLHRQEKRLAKIKGLNTLVLRPGYFFENHMVSLGLIKRQGVNGSAIAGDVAFPMIASADIGPVAARALAHPDFKGQTVQELLGPRDLTMNEATRIIGDAIGRPDLPYVQFPYDAALQGMVSAGLSQSVASLYVEMSRAVNEGKLRSLRGRNPGNTTPTRFEDFAAQAIGPVYRAM